MIWCLVSKRVTGCKLQGESLVIYSIPCNLKQIQRDRNYTYSNE
jgi:hypothetical protein